VCPHGDWRDAVRLTPSGVPPLGAGRPSLSFSGELLRWEANVGVAEAGSPLNKGGFGHLLIARSGAARLLTAGHGGEGNKRTSTTFCRSGVWREVARMLLHMEANLDGMLAFDHHG
jgi:hypothetical protein